MAKKNTAHKTTLVTGSKKVAESVVDSVKEKIEVITAPHRGWPGPDPDKPPASAAAKKRDKESREAKRHARGDKDWKLPPA